MSDIRKRNTDNHEIHLHQELTPNQKSIYILKKKETISQRGIVSTFAQQQIKHMCLKLRKNKQPESNEIEETDKQIEHSIKRVKQTLKKSVPSKNVREKKQYSEPYNPEYTYAFQSHMPKIEETATPAKNVGQQIKTRENTIGIRTSSDEQKNLIAKDYTVIRTGKQEESLAAVQAKKHAAATAKKAAEAEAKKMRLKKLPKRQQKNSQLHQLQKKERHRLLHQEMVECFL